MAFTLISKALLGTALIGSYFTAAYLGDLYELRRNIILPIKYSGIQVEEGFTPHPFSLHHDLELTETNTLTCYQHNTATGERFPVQEDGTVHGTNYHPCLPETLTTIINDTLRITVPDTIYISTDTKETTPFLNKVGRWLQSIPLPDTH
ncbi:hypothetical protein CMO92_01885 [Candidatus Woesearchaeota archaeon]|nr:hypothetical protein [Candidatus Woesearchaeota archaeon]|tara:strand:- start:265 stop:711 length:447 start_codon:yes stop_codon:yes gene_type:complete